MPTFLLSIPFFIISAIVFFTLYKVFKVLGGLKAYIGFCIFVWLFVSYFFLKDAVTPEKGYEAIYYTLAEIIVTVVLLIGFGTPALVVGCFLHKPGPDKPTKEEIEQKAWEKECDEKRLKEQRESEARMAQIDVRLKELFRATEEEELKKKAAEARKLRQMMNKIKKKATKSLVTKSTKVDIKCN